MIYQVKLKHQDTQLIHWIKLKSIFLLSLLYTSKYPYLSQEKRKTMLNEENWLPMAKCYQESICPGKGNNSIWGKMSHKPGRQSRDCQSVRFHNSTEYLLLLFIVTDSWGQKSRHNSERLNWNWTDVFNLYTSNWAAGSKDSHPNPAKQTNKSILSHFSDANYSIWVEFQNWHNTYFCFLSNPSFHVEFIEYHLSKTFDYSSRQEKKKKSGYILIPEMHTKENLKLNIWKVSTKRIRMNFQILICYSAN